MADDTRKPAPIGERKGGRWTKTIWIPRLDDSKRIEVRRLVKELRLEDQAASDGHLNQPGPDDKTLNAPQLEITSRVFDGIALLNQFLSDEISLASKQARQLDPPQIDATGAKARAAEAIDGALAAHTKELIQLKYEELEKKRDLRLFRYKNRLSRSAHYKDSPILVLGLLSGAFVLESVLNGSLLSAVTSNGLSEGALLASAISGLNIILGLVAGYFGWRLAGHRSYLAKALGVAITLGAHTIAITWNLYIAHFREAAELAAASDNYDFNMSALGLQALGQMLSGPMSHMGSIQAWALLLLGLVVHFMSAKEGWDEIEDPYFGYKKYDRKALQAQADFEDALVNLREEAREAVERIEGEVDSEAERASANVNTISELLALAQERRLEIKNSEDEWVAGGTQLLKIYRDINTQVRDEKSAPAYFTVFPSAEDYRKGAYQTGLQSADAEGREQMIEDSIEEIEGLLKAAKDAAKGAEEAADIVRRHIIAAIRRLDKRVEEKDEDVTKAAELRFEHSGVQAADLVAAGLSSQVANAAV